ncbi:hypothetical protein KZ829_01465 [Actinoplanes hulinensis]|uniref:Transposase n=1 Tax=Actinoplanes hulinensis TaxID=1144547 RepID=A0ABS7AUI2_9ACTN|nr:hypothetical protein [Actinoplanes hulinensis]MBW6432412.1 hypothetical protein [Actinoplanes hulinensis]
MTRPAPRSERRRPRRQIRRISIDPDVLARVLAVIAEDVVRKSPPHQD